MSIWCSLPIIGFDKFDVPVGQVRSYANGWSNHYPTTDGTIEREASLDLAYIPAWCCGGQEEDFEAVGPWLRFGLRSHNHNNFDPSEVVAQINAAVVMDEEAVRSLVNELTQWLERPKVAPGDETPGHVDPSKVPDVTGRMVVPPLQPQADTPQTTQRLMT